MSVMNPSERRFELVDDYDRSKYLTTVKPVLTRKFEAYDKRDTGSVIKQGGNFSNIDILKQAGDEFYGG